MSPYHKPQLIMPPYHQGKKYFYDITLGQRLKPTSIERFKTAPDTKESPVNATDLERKINRTASERKRRNSLSQEQIDEIVTAHSTYSGNPYEAVRNLPYAVNTLKKYWKKDGLPLQIKTKNKIPEKSKRQERVDELIAAHQIYDGDPFEAAPKVKSLPYTLIKYWKQANLPIKRRSKDYQPTRKVRIEKSVHQQPGVAIDVIQTTPVSQRKFLDIEEIIAQQNPLILRQYRTIRAYLDVKTVFDYLIKYGKTAEIPENERRLNLSWDLIMEEGEQTIFERLFPQLAEMAKSNRQLVLELPNFADTPLQLRHDRLFTDSLHMEEYRISVSGGKTSRSVLIWKNDKRQFMWNVFLAKTSDYEFGRGAFNTIHAYFFGTERLPISGFSDLEIQGDFHDAATLDNILERLGRLAGVIRKNSKISGLGKPIFVDGEFREAFDLPY